MSNPLAKLREECQRQLAAATEAAYPGTALPESKFSQPPDPKMGELASAASFQLAKVLRQKPADIAVAIAKHVKRHGLVASAEAVNGYINFHADEGNYYKLVFETAAGDPEYGYLKVEKPQRVMVEHTSANPIHPITIGHARNAITGACLANMLRLRGNTMRVDFLVNDMGHQVALATWGWTLLGKPAPDTRGELFIGAIYASTNVSMELLRVNKELKAAEEKGDVPMIAELQEDLEKFETAAADLEKTSPKIYAALKAKIAAYPDPAAEIAKLNTAYENNDPETKKAVRHLVKICIDGFTQTMGEMNIRYDSFDYESDLVWQHKADEVLDALKKTDFVEHDQGALVLNCDSVANIYALKQRWGLAPHHSIPRLVLVRSDGTTLYTLRDMAYSIYKFGTGMDKVINVIGQEQALAQLQLRIALVAIGKPEMGDNQLHYGYEFVKLPEGKMSGRLGRYVALNDVMDRSIELAYDEVTKRVPDLPEAQRRDIARMVGLGAVKYTLLSVDSNKQVTFDWAKALNFETNSAPFIQYSHARCCNILKRVETRPAADFSQLTDPKEREVVSAVANWPEVFAEAADVLKPSTITAYLNSLADKYNSFYSSLRVLNADTPGLIGARLALVDAVRIVLRNGCTALGIEAPERM
ncbi:MAG: arginine--tRNA ligase [Candidatus Bathyarchaeota archaeon]|nr:arginine--tRNA ligase [Candidatus Bathyarchaeota archaeon]